MDIVRSRVLICLTVDAIYTVTVRLIVF